MNGWFWIACIFGLVEGLTEFLPVSSTGHLILTEHLLGAQGAHMESFMIFIQLGAILAVVAAYRGTFLGLLRRPDVPGFSGHRGALFLAVSTIPMLVAGLLLHEVIKERLFNPTTVAIGLAAGAVWILLAERYYSHHNPQPLTSMTWRSALGIGFFQCLALWPGVSRSTCTILGGMLLGLDRKSATEYSFFAAVPVIAAATGYELLNVYKDLTPDLLAMFAVGFAVSFASAWLAIRFLIRFVTRHGLTPFAWYRLAVAALVLWLM